MADPSRAPFFKNQRYEVRRDVEVALENVIRELCATGVIDEIWRDFPCDQGKALEVHAICIHSLGQKFIDKGEVNLSVYADEYYCGLTLQVNSTKGKNETAAFRGIPMSARKALASVGAL